MKETKPFEQDNIRKEQPAQHQKKQQFLTRKPLRKNQTLFEFNFKEDTIKKCPFENADVIHFSQASENIKPLSKKVVIQPNCLYIPALNFKNAIRHIHNKISKEFNPKIIE